MGDREVLEGSLEILVRKRAALDVAIETLQDMFRQEFNITAQPQAPAGGQRVKVDEDDLDRRTRKLLGATKPERKTKPPLARPKKRKAYTSFEELLTVLRRSAEPLTTEGVRVGLDEELNTTISIDKLKVMLGKMLERGLVESPEPGFWEIKE